MLLAIGLCPPRCNVSGPVEKTLDDHAISGRAVKNEIVAKRKGAQTGSNFRPQSSHLRILGETGKARIDFIEKTACGVNAISVRDIQCDLKEILLGEPREMEGGHTA